MQIKATEQVNSYAAFDMFDQLHFKLIELKTADQGHSEASWRLGTHFLDSYMLLFIVNGEGWLTVDGEFVELRSGTIYAAMPGQLVEAEVRGKDERSLYQMRFSISYERETDETSAQAMMKRICDFTTKGEMRCSSPVTMSLICREIEENARHANGLQRYYGQIRFQELLYTMFSDMLQLESNDAMLPIEQARHYMEQHYMDKMTIQDMADAARMSARHFMRLFKKRYGCSAVDYLTIYRIKQAQIMMRNDQNFRLKEIAACVGFQDEMYFRRKFKQISGLPPAAFIRNSKQRIAAVHSQGIGILLALDIIPCASEANHPWTSYYRRKYETDKVTPLVDGEEGCLEQLKTIRPDYIVAVREEMSASMMHRLNSLAPVCVISQSEGDWRDHLRTAAQFLNRPAAAEVWLQRYEQKAAVVRSQLSEQVRTDKLIILSVKDSKIQVMGPRTIASVFYTDLQLNAPQGIENIWQQSHAGIHDLSDLAHLSIDRALIIVNADDESRQKWAELQQSEVWKASNAVQTGSVDMLIPSVLLDYTAFTHELMLDEVLKLWQHRP